VPAPANNPVQTPPISGNSTDPIYQGNYVAGCEQTDQCPSVVTAVGNASHCLAGDATILLADGKKKPLNEVKVGEFVMGFDALDGALKPVKVRIVAMTENEHTVKINVKAADVKKGDVLLLGNGKTLKVKSIRLVEDRGSVYNLQLEGAVGFVADGVRVLSMPFEH
jgi:hypothetical protein